MRIQGWGDVCAVSRRSFGNGRLEMLERSPA